MRMRLLIAIALRCRSYWLRSPRIRSGDRVSTRTHAAPCTRRTNRPSWCPVRRFTSRARHARLWTSHRGRHTATEANIVSSASTRPGNRGDFLQQPAVAVRIVERGIGEVVAPLRNRNRSATVPDIPSGVAAHSGSAAAGELNDHPGHTCNPRPIGRHLWAAVVNHHEAELACRHRGWRNKYATSA